MSGDEGQILAAWTAPHQPGAGAAGREGGFCSAPLPGAQALGRDIRHPSAPLRPAQPKDTPGSGHCTLTFVPSSIQDNPPTPPRGLLWLRPPPLRSEARAAGSASQHSPGPGTSCPREAPSCLQVTCNDETQPSRRSSGETPVPGQKRCDGGDLETRRQQHSLRFGVRQGAGKVLGSHPCELSRAWHKRPHGDGGIGARSAQVRAVSLASY